MSGKITAKAIIRFVLGVLLPVPLFVGIFYFSYFYKSYHGFYHETQTYLSDQHNLEMARQHLRTDAVVFMAMGYFFMGIPSLVYSFLLERLRTRSQFTIRSYIGWGALMGGMAGLIAASLQFVLTDGIYDSLRMLGTSFAVGGMIPLLLLLIASKK